MATLSPGQLASYAKGAGFTGTDVAVAVAVALAESGGRTDAVGDKSIGGSYGLWQIYSKAHPWITSQNWSDPAVNARAAKRVFDEAGGSWRPWSTFKNGSAATYQNTGTMAAAQVGFVIPNVPNLRDLFGGKGSDGGGDGGGWLDGIPDPGDALDAGKETAKGVLTIADAVEKSARWLADRDNWVRMLYVAGGAVVIVVAARMLVNDVPAVQSAQKQVQAVAGVAKTAATKGKA